MSEPIRIVPDTSIQETVDKHPAGSTFLITKGTYYGQMVAPRSGDIFRGEPGTIMDGTNAPKAFAGQGASNVTIEGIAFTGYNPPGNGIGILGTDPSSADWVVRGCEFYQNTGGMSSACVCLGTRMLVEDCTFRNNVCNGVGSWNAEGCVVRSCHFSMNHTYGDSPFTETGWGAAIKIAGSRNTHIVGNDVRDTVAGPGIWTDISCSGTVIENNTVVGNQGGGIMIELDYGAIVRNNHISGNNNPQIDGFEGGGIWISNSQNVEVMGNEVFDNGGGILAYEGQRGSGDQGEWLTRNVYVHDNVVRFDVGKHGTTGSARSDASIVFDNYVSGAGEVVGVTEKSLPQPPEIQLPPPVVQPTPDNRLAERVAALEKQMEALRAALRSW